MDVGGGSVELRVDGCLAFELRVAQWRGLNTCWLRFLTASLMAGDRRCWPATSF